MKLSFLHLVSCICTLMAATGERGAAERAYIFSLYIQEEIYDDPRTQGAIASGCVGTRTGVLGQLNRCTFRELCEYLWAPSFPGQERPDITRAVWQPFTMEIADQYFRNGQRVSEPILRILGQVSINGVRRDWYMGLLNGPNLLPGVIDHPNEYYRAARELGEWDMQARRAISDRIGSGTLTAAEEARFNNWRRESEYALELIVGLREKKIYQSITRAMARPQYFGHRIETQLNLAYQHIRYIGRFPMPDREGTITQYTDQFGGGNAGRAAAAAAYDQAMNAISATEESKSHFEAIASWRHSRVQLRACGFYVWWR
ncbi:hypothetical protein BJY01DRAFT_245473 [Aspergillus pseudoustus]|uniref:Uncharacterized protein n=1 Tax=Aspergillus pseudoustus TaxID=1810923 RepID=A0ABR4KDM9_9EURO